MQFVKQISIALVLGCMVIGSLVAPVAAMDDVYVDGKIITAENYDAATEAEPEAPDDIATEEPDEEEITVRIPIRVKHGE